MNNVERLREALANLVSHIERETCQHDETYRGGAIWEICRDCGAKWADDEGGRPEFKWPECVKTARTMLAAPHPQAEPVAVVMADGYPLWLASWLSSPSYRSLPAGTKLYTAPQPQPQASEEDVALVNAEFRLTVVDESPAVAAWQRIKASLGVVK